MKDLPRRLPVSVVAIPALLWLLFRDDARPFCAVLAVAALGALAETLGLLRRMGLRPLTGVTNAGAQAAYSGLWFIPVPWPDSGIARYRSPSASSKSVSDWLAVVAT